MYLAQVLKNIIKIKLITFIILKKQLNMKRVNVNFKRIVNENKKFQKQAEKNVQSKFLESKEMFFNNFDQHPVTQEINGGPSSSNISNTLNGIGNLFSFIGFYKNSNPIKD
jgi:hypothetical protein